MKKQQLYQINKYRDEEGDINYFVKVKLPNGQTLRIDFQELQGDGIYEYNVCLIIYTKRKQLQDDRLYCKSTGKYGIKTLLVARDIILEFEKYIKDKIAPNKFHKDNKYYVIVGWDNNRRRNVYERGLKKYGYQYTYDDGYKHLKKRII